jgi:hypothetical protein
VVEKPPKKCEMREICICIHIPGHEIVVIVAFRQQPISEEFTTELLQDPFELLNDSLLILMSIFHMNKISYPVATTTPSPAKGTSQLGGSENCPKRAHFLAGRSNSRKNHHPLVMYIFIGGWWSG